MSPPPPLQLTVFHWGNDGLGAHLWHFPPLRLVPNYSWIKRHVRKLYAAARWVQPAFGAAVSAFPPSLIPYVPWLTSLVA